jgi:predicted GIY-YIG superfamily endonuclease
MAFQFLPIELNACVYVLELEDSCVYVGATMNFNVRMAQHFSGIGAKWTKLHKPLKVLEVIYPMIAGLENTITQKYFALYGKEKVRGGSWCRVQSQSTRYSKNNEHTIILDSSLISVPDSEKIKNSLFLIGGNADSSSLTSDEESDR